MDVLGWDTETEMMGPQKLAPQLVCLSANLEDSTFLAGRMEEAELNEMIDNILDTEDQSTVRVAHNLKFDLGVLLNYRPELVTRIFDLLISGHLQCTVVREQLLNLTEFGEVDFILMPDDSQKKADYSLAGLMLHHFGIDLFSDKKSPDAWRTNYIELIDVPVEEWPEKAVSYAVDDSVHVCSLFQLQEERRQAILEVTGQDAFNTLDLRCTADFCLHLMSCWGLEVDPEKKAEIEEMLKKELAPENMKKLVSSGVLRPEVPPRPYKNGAKDEDGNPKMTKGKAASINKAQLASIIEEVCNANDLEVQRTEPTDKCPEGQVSAKMEVIQEIKQYSDVLEEYAHRQSLQKLVTTELPRMEWEGETAAVVHPCYKVLKRTGRTSSYASKIFPSFNCQNVDPRVRGCFKAREGTALFSIDYNQMELGTLAQTCLDLFGHSVLADKINAGYDLHSYLGTQIAIHSDSKFAEQAQDKDADAAYEFFKSLEEDPNEGNRKFFGNYRTLAKPTGLGFPGGLGADTFVTYAKATYGVEITKETAVQLKEIWQNTFTEMPDYFNQMTSECVDERFSEPGSQDVYHYTTPLGMYRPNANYCAAANGRGLQSPSAEGAMLAVINVVRASVDPAMGSVLYGKLRPICFIHDEIVGEVAYGEGEDTDAILEETTRLMTESMMVITPDVISRAEPALMWYWSKKAKPVRNENGNLIPWEPKEN